MFFICFEMYKSEEGGVSLLRLSGRDEMGYREAIKEYN